MTLNSLWQELEATIPDGQPHGRRRLHADAHADLNITITQPGPRRGLSLTVTDDALTNVDTLPASRGLEHLRLPAGPGSSTLEIRLTDPAANELFAALAEDVARITATARDDGGAVGLWLSRIRRWQRLMASATTGLSGEAQLGLYAELHVMRHDLTPRIGIEIAVDGWNGPLGGHDFQLPGGAYEVKASAAHQPQVVTINSERQLDGTGCDSLHLVHLSVDIHRHAGETLPVLVEEIRVLAGGTAAEEALAERLLEAGYSDAHAHHYDTTGYTIRERTYHAVTGGFPRLTEADLPDGIGGVRYQLVMAAITDFAVTPDQALGPLPQRP